MAHSETASMLTAGVGAREKDAKLNAVLAATTPLS